ncbi:MAG: DUF4440 domain-containing protein [bacterium]|nr:DUF4440 domain-containing protein [bacterium]
MKKRTLVLGFCLSAIVLTLPASAGNGKEALISELDALGQKMERSMVEGDIETTLSYYADDAVLLPNWGEKVVGKEAIRKKMESDREGGMRFESFSGKTEDAWECDGKVYAIGTYALSLRLPGIERPVADKGKFIAVWRRGHDGKLAVIYDMWNTDIAMGN